MYKGMLDGRARGRLQRQDLRPAGRAEDRRQADQPDPAPVRRRDDQHQAAARDLRRRREVHPRRDRRAARRGGAVLPAQRAASAGRGAGDARARLRQRDHRPRGASSRSARRWRTVAGDCAGSRCVDRRRAARVEPDCSRSRPAARRRLTAAAGHRHDTLPLDVRRVRADFPILAAAGPRQAARLPRQRGDHAEAAGGDRRADPLLRRAQRERPPRRPPAERAGDGGLRGGPRRRCSAFLNAATPREIVFTRGCHRGASTSSPRAGGARTSGRATRWWSPGMEHHSNIVPWQMLCEQTGARLAWRPDERRGRARPGRRSTRLLSDRGRGSSPSSTCPTRSAPCNPVGEIVALAHARGVPVLVDGAQAVPHTPVDVAGPRLRLLRASPGTRCTAPRASACCTAGGAPRGDAPLAGRRRHDPRRSRSRRPPTTSCPTSSRRARRTSRARWASARRSTTLQAVRASRRSRPTSATCWTTPPRGSTSVPGLRLIGTSPGRRPACSPSCSTASTRTTWAPCSTRRAWRSGPATTAPSP